MSVQPLYPTEVEAESALFASILELIRRTSTQLPDDVVSAVTGARKQEEKGSNADVALDVIGCNIVLARDSSLPLCQDTGTILFYVHTPVGYDQIAFEETATSKTLDPAFEQARSTGKLVLLDGFHPG